MGKNYGLCGNELVEFVGCAILHDNAIAEYIREEFNNDYTEAQKQNIVEMNEIGVAKIADIMSDFYNFDSERHIRFYFAAALHDVGKLIIPNGIALTFLKDMDFKKLSVYNSRMKKKNLVCLLCGFLLVAQSFAQKVDWYLDRQSVYPHKLWITAEGYGNNQAEAEKDALENISLYFQTSTNVVIKAIASYNEASNLNNSLSQSNKSLKKTTTITSQADFFGVQFTTPIQTDGKTVTLATINRDDVFKVYEQRIRNNVDVLKALMTVAEDWNNPVFGIRAAKIAKPIADLTAEEARMARLIKNVSDDYFAEVDDLVKRTNYALEFCQTHLVFKISVKNDYENMLKQALGDILEDAGYEVSDENGYLTIDAKVTSDVEKNDAGIFIYAGFAVTLKTHDGKDFFSYSRNMPKKGHKSESMAYKRAFQGIQSELESSFMEEFNAKLK